MSLIEVRLTDEILFLRLHDPLTRNSFSVAAARELESLLSVYEKKAAALVFSAEGRVFSSGGNLSDYAQMNEAHEGLGVNREISSALDRVAHLPIPTVVAIGGDCFGGGVELASAFDTVIAASHVMMGLWQRRIALTFGWGGGTRLLRRVPEARLREWLISSRSFDAREAHASGLVDQVVTASLLMREAEAAVSRGLRFAKRPLASVKEFSASREQEIFDRLWWSDEHRAALAPRSRKQP